MKKNKVQPECEARLVTGCVNSCQKADPKQRQKMKINVCVIVCVEY